MGWVRRIHWFFLWCWTASLWAGALPFSQGVLFSVQDGQSTPCYLFGTIHSEDPRVLALPAPVQSALDASDTFIMEAIPDPKALMQATLTMVYTDGRHLKGALGGDLYDQTLRILAQRGMPEAAVRDFKPWAVLLLLSVPQSNTGEFLDIRLYQQASAAGKTVAGLETIGEQLAIFEHLAESDQVAMLRETLHNYAQLPEFFERLLQRYVARDLADLVQISDEYLRGGDARLAALFKEAALTVRNQRMAERLTKYIQAGDCFIAIGALHLPGSEGVLARLQDQGFRVQPVY